MTPDLGKVALRIEVVEGVLRALDRWNEVSDEVAASHDTAEARRRLTAAIQALTGRVFADHQDVDSVAVTPQAANAASCRALEKAGLRTCLGRRPGVR